MVRQVDLFWLNVTQNGNGVKIELQGDHRGRHTTTFNIQSEIWGQINNKIQGVKINPYSDLSFNGSYEVNIQHQGGGRIDAAAVKEALKAYGYPLAENANQIQNLYSEQFNKKLRPVDSEWGF